MKEKHSFIQKINLEIEESFNNSKPNFILLGYILIIGFCGFYFLNNYFGNNTLYESLSTRLVIGIFGASLIISKYWPISLQDYWKYYWIVGIILSLSYFFIFMLLMNQNSPIWYVNTIVGIGELALFTSWFLFFICLFIGMITGIIAFFICSPEIFFSSYMVSILPTYFTSLLFFILLMNNKNKIDSVKLDMAKSLVFIVAHELRTPLATIKNCNFVISKYINNNCKSESIIESVSLINDTLNDTNLFIDILCKKTQNLNDFYLENLQIHNICLKNTIDKAIHSIPKTYREKISITNYIDESIIINADSHLFTYVIYNLLDNSIAALHTNKFGNIDIRADINDNFISIKFKDNGIGISKIKLNKIFERFFTDKRNGTGLGLYFCKMAVESMGGSISCSSIEGEYTEFTLNFPILEKENIN
jgi:signal transduction histidine kinase